jgi:hypothetical protein
VQGTTAFVDDADFEEGVINLFLDQSLGPVPSGSTFPPSPSDGDQFFLTTDGQLYVYVAANTRWELRVEPGSIVASDKIVANTITGGLLATTGIITNSAQMNNAVIQTANIGNLQVERIKIATGAVTTSVTTSVSNFVSVSATSTTSPNYSPVRVPSEADFQARPGDFLFVASRSIQIPADDNLAPEQLDVILSVPREPSWTLLSSASELTNLTHGIFVRARVGSTLKLSGNTIYNGSEHFLSQMMYNYFTVGLTNLFGLLKGTEYNAGDLLIFDMYYWRYRSRTRWGIGMTMDGATMNVREFFR